MCAVRLKLFFMICVLLIIQPSFAAGGFVVAQADTPSVRMFPGMQYDPVNNRTFMFGGGTMSGVRGDTWMYDYSTNTWTQIHSSANPAARNAAGMVYDTAHHCMILFGGWLGQSRADDTWIFNCSTDEWTQVFPDVSPGPRMSPNMVFDTTSNTAVMFGGIGNDVTYDDTWMYNFTSNTWTEMTISEHPCGRYGQCMIFDPVRDRTLLFSGNSVDGMNPDMWEYDYVSNNWTDISQIHHPQGRKWGSMVYDSDNGIGILFGGDCNVPEFVNDTWKYDCLTDEWENLSPETAPCVRASPGLAYDSGSQKVILFGGQSKDLNDDYCTLGDTWVFDLATNTWTEKLPEEPSEGLPVHIEWLAVGLGLSVIAVVVIFVWKRKS